MHSRLTRAGGLSSRWVSWASLIMILLLSACGAGDSGGQAQSLGRPVKLVAWGAGAPKSVIPQMQESFAFWDNDGNLLIVVSAETTRLVDGVEWTAPQTWIRTKEWRAGDAAGASRSVFTSVLRPPSNIVPVAVLSVVIDGQTVAPATLAREAEWVGQRPIPQPTPTD